MARTERYKPDQRKGSRNADPTAAKRSQISHALSKLLRHQAESEKVPISPAGWVKLDDLLAWKGLSRIGKDITIADIFDVVEEDGRTGKGRFGVKYNENVGTTPADNVQQGDTSMSPAQSISNSASDTTTAATGSMITSTTNLTLSDPSTQTPPLDPASKNTPETQLALHHHAENPSTSASHYLIRATQGHSIKSIQSTDLLTPLTLTTPDLPNTVVHGTFYGAWPQILATGGLKPMGRNNVHFATGPSLDEVMSVAADDARGMKNKTQVDEVLNKNKVVSGMRWDAQILIYVDLRRCLEEAPDMQWYISGNGVVLTEGTTITQPDSNTAEPANVAIVASASAKAQKHRENIQASRQTTPAPPQKMVPMQYWTIVVEIKNGVGVIWRRGEGIVQELPERLRNMPVPRGKSGHGQERKRGRGGKPRLNVERGDGRVLGDDEGDGILGEE